MLSSLAKNGIIGAELSRDMYHDEIDEEVVKSFTVNNKKKKSYDSFGTIQSITNDMRGIRNNLEFNEPIKAGRCIDGEIRCCCDGPFVHPDGTVTHCGCINSRVIGNVLNEKSLMFLGDEQFDYCEICEPEKAKELQERYP